MVPLNFNRILVIDDNSAILDDFIKILTGDKTSSEFAALDESLFGKQQAKAANLLKLPHFQVDGALQGVKGLELVQQSIKEGKPYSLAFVDIRMPPSWDGVETIKRIWEVDPSIQMVICTAYSDYSWEETISHLGLTDNLLILKKPFDAIVVRQMACALTKKWELMQNNREQMEFLKRRIAERNTSLQNSFSLVRATLESSTDGILIVDSKNKIIDFNQRLIDMWQLPGFILEQKNGTLLFEWFANQSQKSQHFLSKTQNINYDLYSVNIDMIKLKNGRIYERYSQPHKQDEHIVGRVWSFRDVTRNLFLEEQLQHQATHDPLTDLPNRLLLNDVITQCISNAQRENSLVAILFFDLDRFKLINDSLGHEWGDELLNALSQRLNNIVRKGDTLGRWGGDELVLVMPNFKKEEYVINTAVKLLKAIKSPFMINNREIVISASLGVCFYPRDGHNAAELLRNADMAMYKAKEAGADQFRFYDNKFNKLSLSRLEKEAELRHALDNNEFHILYQPFYHLTNHEIVGVEALIRWQHPTKGLIQPLEFIPIAEESGLIIAIGEWVLKTACAQNKAWQDKNLPKIRIAVNVAMAQIRQIDIIEMITKTLSETELEPKYLEIELTENVIFNNMEIIDKIHQLHNMGVQIALDDFGIGNTTLNTLRTFPINHLKIDRSFIQGINVNKNDEVIIKAMIRLAESFNFQILAEGIETQEQLTFLKKHLCHQGQGFYFNKPLSAQDFEKILNQIK